MSTEPAVEAIALLAEPQRAALYRYVASRNGFVGREEAAGAVGIGRSLAAFHLDRLAGAGLLEVRYERLTGRTGPGAGRPAKLYRRAGSEVAVSLPDRSYELAARLFAAAVERGEGPEAVREAAAAYGRELGERARPRGKASAKTLEASLTDAGYEPFREAGGTLRLRNCPFHLLARSHTDLVCGMNLALLEGLAEGLRIEGRRAVLEPREGLCCVAFVRDRTAPGAVRTRRS